MNYTRRRAFTLLELLVSVAIIAILLAMLIPMVAKKKPPTAMKAEQEEPAKPVPPPAVVPRFNMYEWYRAEDGQHNYLFITDTQTGIQYLCVDGKCIVRLGQ